MKDEIKEILDKLKSTTNSKMDFTYTIIQKLEAKSLLDYITNLQEELKSANESISWWQNRFNAVEKENGRYKKIFEGKERFSKIMPDDTDFIILSKSDYDRQQEDIELGLIDYKSRNEKAIEYMSNYIEVEDAPINERIKTEFKEVIRLLTGGDK